MTFLLTTLWLFVTSAGAQTHESVMAALRADPFNCAALSSDLATPAGYRVLSSPQSEEIIREFLQVADRDCVARFAHYYAWSMQTFGTRPSGPPARVPPPSSSPQERPRPRAGPRLCLPFEIPILGCRSQDRDRERRERERQERPAPQRPQRQDVAPAGNQQWTQASRNLSQVLAGLNGTASILYTETGAPQCITPENSIEFLLGAVNDNRQALQCVMPGPGESKIVSFLDGTGSPSGTGMSYTLRNRGRGNYDVVIPLRFVQMPGSTVTPEEMLQRAQACLQSASPYMRSARGQLNIQIVSESQRAALPPSERAPVFEINILGPARDADNRVITDDDSGPVYSRGNAGNYAETFDCPTITHEVLHLLGLCDEYREDYPDYSQRTDLTPQERAEAQRINLETYPGQCRVVPGVPSVMNNQHVAFSQVQTRVNTCECDELCQFAISRTDELGRFFRAPRYADFSDGQFKGDYCRLGSTRSTENYTPGVAALSVEREGPQQARFLSRDLAGAPNHLQVSTVAYVCECPAGDDVCAQQLEQMISSVEDRTLRNEALNCFNGGYRAAGVEEREGAEGERSVLSGATYTRVRRPQATSLLHPAHFDRIIAGNCNALARRYNECSMWARRNLNPDGTCTGRPAHCDNVEAFLGPQR